MSYVSKAAIAFTKTFKTFDKEKHLNTTFQHLLVNRQGVARAALQIS